MNRSSFLGLAVFSVLPSLVMLVVAVLVCQALGCALGWVTFIAANQPWGPSIRLAYLLVLAPILVASLFSATTFLGYTMDVFPCLYLLDHWMWHGGLWAWLFSIGQMVCMAALTLVMFIQPEARWVLLVMWEFITVAVWCYIIGRD
jgi:hypothetical protein